MTGEFVELPPQIAQKAQNEHDGENRHNKNALGAVKKLHHDLAPYNEIGASS